MEGLNNPREKPRLQKCIPIRFYSPLIKVGCKSDSKLSETRGSCPVNSMKLQLQGPLLAGILFFFFFHYFSIEV